MSNGLVICLTHYIYTVLINSFMYIYLLTDGVSSDIQLGSHPVAVSLLRYVHRLDSGVERRASAQVLDHYCHFSLMISLCFVLTEEILYQAHYPYRPASKRRSQLSAP